MARHFATLTDGIDFGSAQAAPAAAEGRRIAADLHNLSDSAALAELDRLFMDRHGTEAHRYARARIALAEAAAEIRAAALAYKYAADRIRARGPSHPPNAAERAAAERAARAEADRRAEAERAARAAARAEADRRSADPLRARRGSEADRRAGFNVDEINRRIWTALARAGALTTEQADRAAAAGLDPASDTDLARARA